MSGEEEKLSSVHASLFIGGGRSFRIAPDPVRLGRIIPKILDSVRLGRIYSEISGLIWLGRIWSDFFGFDLE